MRVGSIRLTDHPGDAAERDGHSNDGNNGECLIKDRPGQKGCDGWCERQEQRRDPGTSIHKRLKEELITDTQTDDARGSQPCNRFTRNIRPPITKDQLVYDKEQDHGHDQP